MDRKRFIGAAQVTIEDIEQHRTMMRLVILRITQDAVVADEVVNQAMWVAYSARHSFAGGSRLSTWLYAIARNAALGWLRRRKRRECLEVPLSPEQFCMDGLVDRLAGKQAAYRLLHLVLELSPKMRRALLVNLYYGNTAEAAASLHITNTALKSRVQRARVHLRQQISGSAS